MIQNFETYNKLGIPLNEQKKLSGVAVDAVLTSVSVATTYKDELTKKGIIFCPISEAIQKHPDLVKKYLGSVIPITDHYFATLIQLYLQMVHLYIFHLIPVALWNFLLILELTPQKPDNLKEHYNC